MMWVMACEAWTLAGKPLPAYTRREIPARLVRRGEARVADDPT